jgi:hypothetical protein
VIAKRNNDDEFDRTTIHAWQTGVFTAMASAGKLPNISQVLARNRSARVRTSVADQRAAMERLSDRLGIPLQPLSPEARAALERMKERQQMEERGH